MWVFLVHLTCKSLSQFLDELEVIILNVGVDLGGQWVEVNSYIAILNQSFLFLPLGQYNVVICQ